MQLDLSDFESIRHFAGNLTTNGRRTAVNVLVHNAATVPAIFGKGAGKEIMEVNCFQIILIRLANLAFF